MIRWETRLSLGAVLGGMTLGTVLALWSILTNDIAVIENAGFRIAAIMVVNGILTLITIQPIRRGDIALFGHVLFGAIWIASLLTVVGAVLWSSDAQSISEFLLRLGGTGIISLAPVCFGVYFICLPRTHVAIKATAMIFLLGVSLAVLAGLIAIWTDGQGEPLIPSRWFETFMAASMLGGIVCLGGLMVTNSIARAFQTKRAADPESMDRRVELEFTCPRCHESILASNGFSKCRECGGVLQVEVEEPRCACGYLLFQLVGDRCPECGRDVPEDQMWKPPLTSATASTQGED